MKHVAHKLTAFLASRGFFYGILGFFVLNALWFVFTVLFPLAFDEDFHLGVIRIYAEQWSPFLSGQPANGDAYGSLATDPSYLFHYLMSFPLRFIALFTQSETIQVIFLRLINVAIFAWSLVLYRKVLLRAKASPALTHTVLAIFVLIPIVPQLAAHINYDNVLMLLFAWLCLIVFRITESLQQRRIDVPAILLFIIVCLFTSLIKYAALPLLVGAVIFLLYMAFRSYRGHWRQLYKGAKGGFVRINRRTKIVLLTVLFIGLGLFAQRYVVNMVKYQSPVPDCGKVLRVDQCVKYGPWGRDHGLEQSKDKDFQPDVGYFVKEWLKGMRHRLFFAVSGAKTGFINYIELPLPVAAFTVLVVLGVLAIGIWFRAIFAGQPFLVFFGITTLVYLVVLLLDQFGMYKQTSVPVAINGRYLLPILPVVAVIAARGFAYALAKFKAQVIQPYLAVLTILLFLQGGGMLTYLLRADTHWYWPNQTVRDINEGARKVIAPVIIEGDKYKDWH
ncbi:MAG TPA: hypothetical protein VD735_01915 [Candidatus Saccharimonadales bacterium]|nr:hypothetical protein [Candidatus Saccharimonadales bacterium]